MYLTLATSNDIFFSTRVSAILSSITGGSSLHDADNDFTMTSGSLTLASENKF